MNWMAHSQFQGFEEYEPGPNVKALAREILTESLENWIQMDKPILYVAVDSNGKPYADTVVCSRHYAEFFSDFNRTLVECGDKPFRHSDFVGAKDEEKKYGCIYCAMKPGLQAEC